MTSYDHNGLGTFSSLEEHIVTQGGAGILLLAAIASDETIKPCR